MNRLHSRAAAWSKEWFRGFFDREYLGLLRAQWSPAQTRTQADFIARALGLRRGDRVLDVGCGYGRHAAVLAGRGLEVTGLDLSRDMIAEARRLWRGRPRLQFVRGDMRRLPYRARFDAVLSLFTSFGYFTHRENLRTLAGMVRALKPGGRILLDVRNLEHALVHPAPNRWTRVGRDRFVLEESRVDPRSGRVESSWWLLQLGRRRATRKRFRMRMYRMPELRSMLREAGARLEAAFGGFDGSSYQGHRHPRLIVVARRPT